ncbi:hypothetical protein RB623_08385 [Mesorhizobium sp. LHD-90]|uniref:hypothetical protein n=1 Tax=Mesorhizobium sp. LHD-90 TaxID=3071414 RepID=UPI0027E003AD|nr:hypothetical protein [Mesorhizobium sp. LHD-90]MDQ6434063.1 hypothetical protein [Mesorhizobium sp. LHD-90]
MMLDRLFALLALVALVAFLWIVAARVGRADLAIAIAIGIAFVCYDLWLQLFRRRR